MLLYFAHLTEHQRGQHRTLTHWLEKGKITRTRLNTATQLAQQIKQKTSTIPYTPDPALLTHKAPNHQGPGHYASGHLSTLISTAQQLNRPFTKRDIHTHSLLTPAQTENILTIATRAGITTPPTQQKPINGTKHARHWKLLI